jgi:hypothetical protein
MDRYVTVAQGEVFFITEALAALEGIEKGPAGNTALTAAFSVAQEMDRDRTVLIQETEYTGAGKHIQAQLSFARENGIDVFFGDPAEEIPGKNIILPSHPSLIKAKDVDLEHLRASLIKTAIGAGAAGLSEEDVAFLAEETKTSPEFVKKWAKS